MDRRVFLSAIAAAAAFPVVAAKGLFRPTKLVPMPKVAIPPFVSKVSDSDIMDFVQSQMAAVADQMAEDLARDIYGRGRWEVNTSSWIRNPPCILGSLAV